MASRAGPAGAVVATLHRLRWTAVGPANCVTERGVPVDLELMGGVYLRTLVMESVDAWVAVQVAREVKGPTLKAGAFWEPLRRAIAEATPRRASYLRSVASGTAWAQARLVKATRAETPVCQVCQEETGTLRHWRYECGRWPAWKGPSAHQARCWELR